MRVINKIEKNLRWMIRFETLEGVVQRTNLNDSGATFLLDNNTIRVISHDPYPVKDGAQVIVLGTGCNYYFTALAIKNKTTNTIVKYYRFVYTFLGLGFSFTVITIFCILMGHLNQIILFILLISYFLTHFLLLVPAIQAFKLIRKFQK
jgi:hypothetical protein